MCIPVVGSGTRVCSVSYVDCGQRSEVVTAVYIEAPFEGWLCKWVSGCLSCADVGICSGMHNAQSMVL